MMNRIISVIRSGKSEFVQALTFAFISIVLIFTACEPKKENYPQNVKNAVLRGDWSTVITNGIEWVNREPDNPIPHYLLAIGYCYTGRRAQQEAELSIALRDKEHKETVASWCSQLVKYSPRNTFAYLLLGTIRESEGFFEEAISCYKKAIEIDPKFSLGHSSLGHAYLTNGQFEEALRSYMEVIRINPGDANAYVNAGNVFVSKGKLDTAIVLFRKAVEIDPRNVVAYHNLGSACLDKGLKNEAIKIFREVFELDPYSSIGRSARRYLEDLTEGLPITLQPLEIKGIVGKPGAQVAAIYIAKIKNNSECRVHNCIADLYLLDLFSQDHLILSQDLGNIDSHEEVNIMWTLNSGSAIAKEWRTRQTMEFAEKGVYHTTQPPAILIYVRSSEGVYEVDATKYTLYYPVYGEEDVLQPAEFKVSPNAIQKIFRESGVKLPKTK